MEFVESVDSAKSCIGCIFSTEAVKTCCEMNFLVSSNFVIFVGNSD